MQDKVKYLSINSTNELILQWRAKGYEVVFYAEGYENAA